MIIPLSDPALYETIRDFFAMEENLSLAQANRVYSDQKLALLEEADPQLFAHYAEQAANWLERKLEQE